MRQPAAAALKLGRSHHQTARSHGQDGVTSASGEGGTRHSDSGVRVQTAPGRWRVSPALAGMAVWSTQLFTFCPQTEWDRKTLLKHHFSLTEARQNGISEPQADETVWWALGKTWCSQLFKDLKYISETGWCDPGLGWEGGSRSIFTNTSGHYKRWGGGRLPPVTPTLLVTRSLTLTLPALPLVARPAGALVGGGCVLTQGIDVAVI